MNLLQNKIDSIGNDSQIKKVHGATKGYYTSKNKYGSSGYQNTIDVIESAREDIKF